MLKKVILIILDGWGHGSPDNTNAIYLANTPFIDSLYQQYPNSELKTFGENVGLPDGQMGNSEVGHLNIGAGRIVYQDLVKINKAIREGELAQNKELINAFQYAKKQHKKVHFIGLVSDGGIHSHQNHLINLCQIAHQNEVKNTFIHAFTDGRDTDPKGGINYLSNLQKEIAGTTTQIASVIGRYYAMDRDKRWERIKLAYDLLAKGIGEKSTDLLTSIRQQYNNNITDEFLLPLIKVDENKKPIALIEKDDVVIFFNYRTDRCRQITEVLTQKAMPQFDMNPLSLYYVTMTEYNKNFKGIKVLFKKDNLQKTLGEVISKSGLKQLRIAETEKYPHVTFFFSGGREEPFENESRILVNSPKVPTYDLQPEMSALEVTQKIVDEINRQSTEFICLNFANPDMVGHTGNQQAIIKAVEVMDACTKKIVEVGLKNEYQFLIIADHGNAEKNKNKDGSPHTSHTTNLVPCFALNTGFSKLKDGILADIAPTILALLQIPQPKEMTGTVLLA